MSNITNSAYPLSCDQFAANQFVKSQTVRARLSRTGSYFGIRPIKLANGRTAWPDIQVTAADSASFGQ